MKKLAVTALVFCLLLSGCAKTKIKSTGTNTRKYKAGNFSDSYIENGTVYENDAFELRWDSSGKRVSFFEKSIGAVWGATPVEASEASLNDDDMPVKNHPQVDSALIVYYYDPKTLSENIALSYVESVINDGVYTEIINGGLKVIYDFPNLQISVPVEYTLENNHFRITVKPEEIADNGTNYVTAVALSPFMCSLQNGAEDGYLFLPDGSGTLIKPIQTDLIGTEGMKKVYGEDLAIQTYDFYSTVKNINLPVYGVKKGDKALLCVIDQGAEAAYIGWKIGSQAMKYSSLYSFFRIRGYSLIEPPGGFAGANMEVKVFSGTINTQPLSIAYFPLSGENADYVGMADIYRNYLIANKGMKETGNEEKAAAFKYIGGFMQKRFLFGFPYHSISKLTTTGDVKKMTEYFKTEINDNFLVNLVGFGTTGLDFGKAAGGFTAASGLGGKKGINSLSEYCEQLQIPLFMDFDLIAFAKPGNGFSRKDAAVLPNGQPVRFSSFNTATRKKNADRSWLLGREQLMSASQKLTEAVPEMGLKGVSLSSISKIIYSDYTDAATSVSGGMSRDIAEIFKKVKGSSLSALAGAANDYAALSADYITDAPIYSSGYDFSYTDVPFYEIVFKGYIPMSSSAVNLSADENDALLRCIESGIAPAYTLYYRYSNEYITTKYSFTFGGEFDGNKKRIVEALSSLKDYYGNVNKAKIISHEILDNDIRVTRFMGGVYTVVNYSGTDAVTPYGNVSAGGFITGVSEH